MGCRSHPSCCQIPLAVACLPILNSLPYSATMPSRLEHLQGILHRIQALSLRRQESPQWRLGRLSDTYRLFLKVWPPLWLTEMGRLRLNFPPVAYSCTTQSPCKRYRNATTLSVSRFLNSTQGAITCFHVANSISPSGTSELGLPYSRLACCNQHRSQLLS